MTIEKGQDWLDRYRIRTGKEHPFEKEYQAAQAGKSMTGKQVRAVLAEKIKPLEDEYAAAQAARDKAMDMSQEAYKPICKIMCTEEYWNGWDYTKGDEATAAWIKAHPEDKGLWEEHTRLQREALAAAEKAQDLRAKLNQAVIAALSVSAPIPLTTDVSYLEAKDTRHDVVKRGVAMFQRLVSQRAIGKGAGLPEVVVSPTTAGRSHCLGDKYIALNVFANMVTMVHELGHVLEANSWTIKRLAQDFLAKRTAGEQATPLGKDYDPSEIAKADRFPDKYVGKIYPGGSTEVISMGLQYLAQKPLDFMRQDPHYFDFIYAIARGDISEAQAIVGQDQDGYK